MLRETNYVNKYVNDEITNFKLGNYRLLKVNDKSEWDIVEKNGISYDWSGIDLHDFLMIKKNDDILFLTKNKYDFTNFIENGRKVTTDFDEVEGGYIVYHGGLYGIKNPSIWEFEWLIPYYHDILIISLNNNSEFAFGSTIEVYNKIEELDEIIETKGLFRIYVRDNRAFFMY